MTDRETTRARRAPVSTSSVRRRRDGTTPAARTIRQRHADESLASERLLVLQRRVDRSRANTERASMQRRALGRDAPDPALQRAELDEEELLQGQFPADGESASRVAPSANRDGLPDPLRHGIERLSGLSMEGVRVHRDSAAPAAVAAHAYAQGNDIHLAPNQEHHLPHEAWHVVQQRQGRVRPTTAVAGLPVNDDVSLEREADVMGQRASSMVSVDHERD